MPRDWFVLHRKIAEKWYSVEKTEISLEREKLDESVCFTEIKLFQSKLHVLYMKNINR